MPTKIKLTKTAVEAIVPPATGERVVWDRELSRFRRARGPHRAAHVFRLCRTTGGRQVKLKVGVHGAVTADGARDLASVELGKLMAGQDPSEERRQAREAERARRVAPTMRGLADEYMSAHAELHKRPTSIKNDRAMLEKIILPPLGEKRVAHVSHKDIETLHGELRETPYVANRVVALLSKIFGLAIKWQMRADNPARGVTRFQEQKRERFLRQDEIARLTDVLATHPNRAHANAVRLLLLTGARRGEVLSATWDANQLRHRHLDETVIAYQAEAHARCAAGAAGIAAFRRHKGRGGGDVGQSSAPGQGGRPDRQTVAVHFSR